LKDLFDLDAGVPAAILANADLSWEPAGASRQLAPESRVLLGLVTLPSGSSFEALTKQQLEALTPGAAPILDAQVVPGAVLVVRTNQGSMAKLRIEAKNSTSFALAFRWVTFR
jgi:hypothetical protein